MRRRTVLTGVSGAILATSAGCLDPLFGSATFAATPATVDDGILERTGYDHIDTRQTVEEREFSARTVEVTNWIAEYHRGVDLPVIGRIDGAVFAVLATPRVDVLGRSFNPVAEMTDRELAETIQAQYRSLSIGEEISSRSVDTLETTATVTRFTGTAHLLPIDRADLTIELSISRFAHEADFLVAVGIAPSILLNEDNRQRTLLAGLDH